MSNVTPDYDPNRVLVFDTTLRDGEQSPGASMNREEKLQVARALARLNVDIIEAGFPIASPGDFDAVKAIAEEIDGPIIAVPVLDGALVLSQRGGDFELVLGRDLSVGYSDHDARSVRLYFEESLTFRLLGPSAAVPLVYQSE